LNQISTVDEDVPFIKSITSELDISDLITDFQYSNGINPYKSGENSLYGIDLYVKNVIRLVTKVCLLMMILWVITFINLS